MTTFPKLSRSWTVTGVPDAEVTFCVMVRGALVNPSLLAAPAVIVNDELVADVSAPSVAVSV